MADRDDDRDRSVDDAILRILHSRPGDAAPTPTDGSAAEAASREALEHLDDPRLAADMAAVRVPMNRLLREAELVVAQRDEIAAPAWSRVLAKIRRWFWNPGIAYAVAVGVAALAMFGGRFLAPAGVALQLVALNESAVTRSGGEPRQAGYDAGREDMRLVVLDRGADMIDLQVDRPVDPQRDIRYRAILEEMTADGRVSVAFTADNRQFAPAPAGQAYPVFRVPAHLLRPGVIYELRFEPVRPDGELVGSGPISARFRIAG